jgi:hypothetical protein
MRCLLSVMPCLDAEQNVEFVELRNMEQAIKVNLSGLGYGG